MSYYLEIQSYKYVQQELVLPVHQVIYRSYKTAEPVNYVG
jgi:hypothetical protein